MIIILTILDLVCLFICLPAVFSQDNILKTAILTLSVFSFLYIIVSGLFFWFDAFSFIRVLGCLLVVLMPLTAYTALKTFAGIVKLFQKPGVHMVEVILVIITALFSIQNFELYASGQDQGLYQVEAIELYMGNFEVEHDFEEYQILESAEDKAAYLEMVTTGIPGYYPLSNYDRIKFDETERLSDVSGMYHGIQTFPAILALGGKLLDLENMMQVQTIFLICSVMLLYYALCNMGLPISKRIAALAVFLLSPLVLWISKTAFTEMLLTLCMAFYLFLMTETDLLQKRLLLSLPLIAFSYVHVSFLVIYPVFILIHALLYFRSGQKEYLWVNLLVSVGLTTGYFMMARIGPQYFFDNVSKLYLGNIITAENFLYWVCCGTVAVCVFSLLLVKIKNPDSVYQKIVKASKFGAVAIFAMLAVIIFNIVLIGFFRSPEDGWVSWLTPYYGSGIFNAFGHSTFFAFAMATGFLVLPCILWYVIKYHNNNWTSPYEMTVYFLLIYCILFQSAFIRKEVYYYYYYSRYLVFYIPILCLAFAILLKKWKGRILWGVWVLSVVCMTGFDVPLLTQNDQTMLEWENLQDLRAAIQDDSAIILDPGVVTLLGHHVKAITGEAIFPIMSDLEKETLMLQNHFQNIYYLSKGDSSAGIALEECGFELIYRDKYTHQTTGATSEGYFPVKFPSNMRELVLYGLETVSVTMDSIRVKGGEKTDEYITSTGASGLVIYGPYVSLRKGDYILKIPIKVDSQSQDSLGYCYIGNVSEGAGSILSSTPIEDFLDEEETILNIPFHLDKFTEKIEFKIDAAEGSIFRIYPYQYRQILYGSDNSIANVTEIPLGTFGSQNKLKYDIRVCSSGDKGYLLYGPYIPMEPGSYHITINGELYSGDLNDSSFFDVTSEKGENVIIRVSNLDQFITGSEFELNVGFEIPESLNDCEFRVFVNEGVKLGIGQVTLKLDEEESGP